ncbi:family transcriptional regulator, putative [Babesia ovata]|uniref:Family transcriptional regulator, putative n=1 Tax=Babesia ovata TaxID=189622 RepID=A0A2H6KEV8_9APIC|nr:family transcriptional regulator, putative [Babesia ovata]GBE61531.1 family transcriptional regulator, putative [Babesia ovata]
MSLFARDGSAAFGVGTSPVLSPARWSHNGPRHGLADGFDRSDGAWLRSRSRGLEKGSLRSGTTQPWSSRPDVFRRPSDSLHGTTPDIRALRSRIMDSPGHLGTIDVPPYLRSVDNRKLSHTPKRATFARTALSPRRSGDLLGDDGGFSFRSPLLSGKSRLKRRSRTSLSDLRIGSYAPYVPDARSVNPPYRPERHTDALETYRITPNRERINIHATDDILNRIKRSLSECESISKRLDKQYGTKRAQQPNTDYSERVFPRALADNLFTSRGSDAPNYRNRVHLGKSTFTSSVDDAYRKRELSEPEKPKSALTRIIDNIKRIRNRALFSDSDDSGGKRNFVEVEKEAIESPMLSRRQRALDVDAIQRRIKQQKRNLLSQRPSARFE